MTNKTTKSALLTSSISLLLCFAMLLGTTFAWFTDTVTSANNIIKSGNLDVEFEYWDGDSWETVQGASDILTNTLWEPGVTEVAYLRVANAGSLALKYQLGVNIKSETDGKNVAEEAFKLSDYLMFGMIEGKNGETDAFSKDDAGRTAAIAAVTDEKKISEGYTKEAQIAAGANTEYFALVVYMPETVGNEANHNGTDVPEINLGINVFATQVDNEGDSFNDQYDAEATYPEGIEVSTANELMNVVGTGKTAIIAEDAVITLDDSAVIENTVVGQAAIVNEGTLNIVGGEYANGDTTNSSSAVIENRGTLTISGGEFGTDGNSGRAVSNIGGNVTIDGGTFSAFDRNVHTSRAAYVFSTSGGTITINDGTSIGAPNGIFYASNGGEIIVNGGTFNKGAAANNYYLAYANGGTIKLNGGTYTFENSDECIWPFYDSIDGLKYNTTTQIYLDDSCIVNWDRNK